MNTWVYTAVETYLIVINLVSFIVFGTDKMRAIRDEWRIKERTLLLLCAVGGSLGGLIGVFLLHHKNQKLKFRFGIPVMFIIQMIVILYFR